MDQGFRGGIRPAAGDINHDTIPELVIAAGFGGGPRIAVINGTKVLSTDGFASADRLVPDFFIFEPVLRNGSYVAIGDVNGDGFGDLAFGAGPGGAPRLLMLSGQDVLSKGTASAIGSPLANFFVAGNSTDRGGVRVAAADVDQDGRTELITGTGEGQSSSVRVYAATSFIGTGEPAGAQVLDPFGGAVFPNGVYVR